MYHALCQFRKRNLAVLYDKGQRRPSCQRHTLPECNAIECRFLTVELPAAVTWAE